MPGDKVFLDTNIILYAYDVSAGEKHKRAKEIVLDLWNSGLAVISTQVLQEFFVTATQKIPKPLDTRFAKDIVNDLLKWEVVINDGVAVLDAIELLLQYGYSFWDSLIVEASIKGGAEILLSEDLSHGQTIQGVTIMNPFKTTPS
jgi:predicted nucleic acid-binding protein